MVFFLHIYPVVPCGGGKMESDTSCWIMANSGNGVEEFAID